MNTVLDFIRGAAPWVPLGLLAALFAVRSAAKDRKNKQSDEQHSTGGTRA